MEIPKTKKVTYDESIRTIWIYDEIDKVISKEVISILNYLDSHPISLVNISEFPILKDNGDILDQLKNIHKELNSITLIINSDGGLIYECLSIIDAINNCKNKVNSIIEGNVCSASACLAFCCTGIRAMKKHSTVMVHDGVIGKDDTENTLKQKENEIFETKRIINYLAQLVSKRSKLSYSYIKKNLFQPVDCYLNAKCVLDLNLIDIIL